MFQFNHNHGLTFKFDNGYEVSVQAGTGNYCSRRDLSDNGNDLKDVLVHSNTVELAVFRANVEGSDAIVPLPHKPSDFTRNLRRKVPVNATAGWVTVETVVDWLAAVKRAPDWRD